MMGLGSGHSGRGFLARTALLVVVVSLGVGVIACGEEGDEGLDTTTTLAGPQTTVAATPTTDLATATSSSTTVEPVSLSAESITYAESLGGTSQMGETLYFVIGDMVESEQRAQDLLEEATPFFGDMQSYFIVQRSDNFEGMEPGWWVIIEAYLDEPSAENLDFGLRGFPEAYVESAKVLTSDPIPVYEDRLGL
jgi:hypothetical protein